MRVIKFYSHHLNGFEPQDKQAGILHSSREHLKALEMQDHSFSVVDANGRIVAVAGLAQIWGGRWTAWCALSVHARHHMRELTRLAKAELEKFADQRVEACTDVDFEPGARWLRMLGFECEVPHAKRLVPGQQLSLYVRA